jgi:GNAT superfamily N-acetyltransferase
MHPLPIKITRLDLEEPATADPGDYSGETPAEGRPGLKVEMLTPTEWKTLRDVRLRALKDSPTAFDSSYEIEASWGEAHWRRRFEDARWVVARRGRRIVGLARSVRVQGRPPQERHLESVWVEPGHRGTGVTRALLRSLTEHDPSVREWRVWVLDTNPEARLVYERLGFVATGERQVLPDASGRGEYRLGLVVRQSSWLV